MCHLKRYNFLEAILLPFLTVNISAKVIYVGNEGLADFSSIQVGINAAESGDTVSVAPGTYYENITLKDGIRLIGAGAAMTIIDAQRYGDVVDVRANDVVISGFTLQHSGRSDLGHFNCGVYAKKSNNLIIKNSVIYGNRIGIGVWDCADLDIRNNVIEHNTDGIYIYGTVEEPANPTIINNTIVNNQTNGITLRVMVSPVIVNNIIVGHATGINHNYVTGAPILSYNNLWDNGGHYRRDNVIDNTLAGAGSLFVDPCFVTPGHWSDANDPNSLWVRGDYHLKSSVGRWDPIRESWVMDEVTSSCIDAADPNTPVGDEPFPNGVLINMGAYGGTAEASKSYSDIPGVVNVGDSDNGSQVTLRQGQILAVTLASNPSTGYSWASVEKQNSIFEPFGDPLYFPPEEVDGIVGTGGWEILYFRSVRAGQEMLQLVYRRPWETDEQPIKTFSIDVVVE